MFVAAVGRFYMRMRNIDTNLQSKMFMRTAPSALACERQCLNVNYILYKHFATKMQANGCAAFAHSHGRTDNCILYPNIEDHLDQFNASDYTFYVPKSYLKFERRCIV